MLPAPRNPLITVIGIFFEALIKLLVPLFTEDEDEDEDVADNLELLENRAVAIDPIELTAGAVFVRNENCTNRPISGIFKLTMKWKPKQKIRKNLRQLFLD